MRFIPVEELPSKRKCRCPRNKELFELFDAFEKSIDKVVRIEFTSDDYMDIRSLTNALNQFIKLYKYPVKLALRNGVAYLIKT